MRHYRPLVEQLERRELLAFNLTISLAASAGVNSSTNTATDTVTFTAVANGANLSIASINAALAAKNSVVISSGSTGSQAGNISTSGFTAQVLNNLDGESLTIQTGSGTGLVGDINLSGLRLAKSGTLEIQADRSVALSNVFFADKMTIIAAGGSISMPSGG